MKTSLEKALPTADWPLAVALRLAFAGRELPLRVGFASLQVPAVSLGWRPEWTTGSCGRNPFIPRFQPFPSQL